MVDEDGDPIYEGKTDDGYLDTSDWKPGDYIIYFLDENDDPLGQMFVTIGDDGIPLALANTGDHSLPNVVLFVVMFTMLGLMITIVIRRRKESIE